MSPEHTNAISKSIKETEEKHLLEGKYIIFVYSEGDAEGEGSVLNLAQLKKNRLEFLYSPQSWADPADLEEIDSVAKVLEILGKEKIKTVYSVFHTRDFFGIPFGEQLFEESEEPEGTGEIEDEEEELVESERSWYEYENLSARTDLNAYETLEQAGIKIIHWDEDRQQEY